MRHPRSFAPLAIVAVFGLSACLKSEPEQKNKARAARPPAKVVLADVRTGTIPDRWRFLGDVRSASRASLASGASGTVTKVLVREGDRVAKGKLLVQVDRALAAARLEVVKADERAATEALEQARREHQRLERLENNIVAAVELERARSRIQELSARLNGLAAKTKEAAAELRLHMVRAPFDGAVAARNVDPGDWVRPGDAVLELVSTGNVEILVDASRELFRRVQTGDAVTIIADTARTDGKVVGVVPALSAVSRTMRVRVVPTKDAAGLLPGSAVQVEFRIDLSGEGGVVVPEDALLPGPTSTNVVLVVDGKAKPINVTIIAKANGDALVRAEGLVPGARVVVRGNERLRPGQAVTSE